MASVGFFDRQFQKQVQDGSFALNPFETLALEHLHGDVLDLGAGLGNLSLEAARRGHDVVAVEMSPTAITHIREHAAREILPVEVIHANLADWEADRDFDTVVAIGLLMFFREEGAIAMLERMRRHVRPGGRLILNVLIEGTTFLDMFEGDYYHLFRQGELEERLADWEPLLSRQDSFPAPEETLKVFSTLVYRRP